MKLVILYLIGEPSSESAVGRTLPHVTEILAVGSSQSTGLVRIVAEVSEETTVNKLAQRFPLGTQVNFTNMRRAALIAATYPHAKWVDHSVPNLLAAANLLAAK